MGGSWILLQVTHFGAKNGASSPLHSLAFPVRFSCCSLVWPGQRQQGSRGHLVASAVAVAESPAAGGHGLCSLQDSDWLSDRVTVTTLSALEIPEFLVDREITLYIHSSVSQNPSSFGYCKRNRYPREDGTNCCYNYILSFCCHDFCKVCFMETFSKLFGEEQEAFGTQFYIKSLQFCQAVFVETLYIVEATTCP